MNLLHLKYAVEVARTRSITRAAENLFMGQPNLSRAIRELEKELGVTLFRRTTKGIVPTKQGEEFLEHARLVLLQVQQLESLYADNSPQRVFNACLPRAAYCTHAFARFAAGSGEDGPVISVRETAAQQALEYVAEGLCSFAVVRTDPSEEESWQKRFNSLDLKEETLWQAPMVALLPYNSPLADRPAVTAEELKELIEVCYGDAVFSAAGENRRIAVHEQSGRFELLCELQNSYMWDSPTPAAVLKRYKLVQRPCIEAPFFFCDRLIYKKFFRLGKEDARFLSLLKRAQTQAAQALKRL